ncbi:MAG TPA: GFA family protein [Steroidobacteraceae bacterium]|nr:GFA family protein [Steroidobacteraceae bacterium]
MSTEYVLHHGGCHCGAISYTVQAPADLEVWECNCSICTMTGFLHLIVPAERFHLLGGEAALVNYTFNTGVARHLFCRHCGVKSFYVPRSNPDGYSVNLRCLNRDTVGAVTVRQFDDRDRERSDAAVRGLSHGE